jgi:hypothetical protein
MGENLDNTGSQKVDATENQNTTGEWSPIVSWEPKAGLKILLENMAEGKGGVPIYAEFQDSGGSDLPRDTEIRIQWDTPSNDQPQVVSEVRRDIRPWRTLSLTEQQDSDYRDRTRLELKGAAVETMDFEDLEFAIKSSTQIDWSNSRLALGRRHVNIVSGD